MRKKRALHYENITSDKQTRLFCCYITPGATQTFISLAQVVDDVLASYQHHEKKIQVHIRQQYTSQQSSNFQHMDIHRLCHMYTHDYIMFLS